MSEKAKRRSAALRIAMALVRMGEKESLRDCKEVFEVSERETLERLLALRDEIERKLIATGRTNYLGETMSERARRLAAENEADV